MFDGWIVILSALVYVLLLFAIANFGDRMAQKSHRLTSRPFIYALSLSLYCSAWIFSGAIGHASRAGFEFLAFFLGPLLLFVPGFPLIKRIIRICKAERITSIAGLLAMRYGRSHAVAGATVLVATVGLVPYLALQMRALQLSITTLAFPGTASADVSVSPFLGLVLAVVLAALAIVFGTRRGDATEHQDGLMFAAAVDAVIKLIALLAVGFWVTNHLHAGPFDLLQKVVDAPQVSTIFESSFHWENWLTITLLSACAVLLLPPQFHATVTENNSEAETRRSAWVFPIYLVLFALFILPVTAAGLLRFGTSINPDSFLLALPLAAHEIPLALLTFLAGLSASLLMTIAGCVAVAIMVSNDVVVPFLWRKRIKGDVDTSTANIRQTVLAIRRVSICVLLLLSYLYNLAVSQETLSSSGLLAMAAIAQLVPALIGGLFWRGATARGTLAGLVAGFIIWLALLFVPSFFHQQPLSAGAGAFSPLAQGVFWSLALNLVFFVTFSLVKRPGPNELMQANVFVPLTFTTHPFRLNRSEVTIADLEATLARYLGPERTHRSFLLYAKERDRGISPSAEVDMQIMRFAEQLLASTIGAASAQLVLTIMLKKHDPSTRAAMQLLDEASAAIQFNRDLLQTALDQVIQGLAVFDRDLHLICWNRPFCELLNLPAEYGKVGTSLESVIEFQASRGEFGEAPFADLVCERMERIVLKQTAFQERLQKSGSVLEVGVSPMPGGGLVLTFTDITARALAAEELARSNETLERRVRERTEELTTLNARLVEATHEAEEANIGKTRFLAAAGHDILQPLNAARLYSSLLTERLGEGENGELVKNVEASLESVEDILGAVLDISRLDTGALKPEISNFRLDEILQALEREFEPVASEKNVKLTFVQTALAVRSDKRLLRRLLQNLISNALKYTLTGRVLVGCRRRGHKLEVQVFDTGLGIDASQQKVIFLEFQRLDEGVRTARGLGLGLSIVDRISRVLNHPVTLTSTVGKGSCFAVHIPVAITLPETHAAQTPAVRRGDLSGLVVLAIDNEKDILEGMRGLLESWHCEVMTASDETEAAAAIRLNGRIPDIILADYHLDNHTGIDTIIRLRWKFGPGLPALLITADRSADVKNEAQAKDISIMRKPVKPAILRAHLASCRAEASAAE